MTTERMPEEVSKIFQEDDKAWMRIFDSGLPPPFYYSDATEPETTAEDLEPKPVSVQTCFKKLIRAGFRVIRRQDNIIKECRALNADFTQFEWYHLEKFPSKAAAQRKMNELLQDEMTIEL